MANFRQFIKCQKSKISEHELRNLQSKFLVCQKASLSDTQEPPNTPTSSTITQARGWRFLTGLWHQNPVFRLILGMCPTLAVTNAAINGLVMGIATLFVLVCSGIIVSLIRKLVPSKVRIPSFIVIIATFVTIADYILAAAVPPIHKVLGIYVPLIVVNCIIMGRMEAFASKNTLVDSLYDSFGMGFGFTWGLIILGSIRELLGFGTVFGFTILGSWYPQMIIMKLPAGAFITLGFLIALMNMISKKRAKAACHTVEKDD